MCPNANTVNNIFKPSNIFYIPELGDIEFSFHVLLLYTGKSPLYQVYKIMSGESTYSDVTVMTKVLQLGQKAKSRRHSPSDPKMTFYPLTSKWVKQKGCENYVSQ
jgi:hypothetical protein